MTGKTGHDDKRNGNRHPLLIAAVSAFLGSGGGVALVFNTDIGQGLTRPDPFTGTEAAALTQRIAHLESDIADHLQHHPDRENQFDRRIATLEAQYAIILGNQARILDRLDRM